MNEPVMWQVRCDLHPRWRQVAASQVEEHRTEGWDVRALCVAGGPPALTKEQMNKIIAALDLAGRAHCSYECGLPTWDDGQMALMREAIAEALK